MNIGDKNISKDIVCERNIASSVGSGLLPVYSTPFMVSLMENAASDYLAKELPEGKGSVGIHIDIDHISATPVGMAVYAQAEVTGISENGKIIDFKVEAYDEAGLIGKGSHTRAVITNDRFMEKCLSKLDM